MSDPHGRPRRVSLGYILGFSDKPFKDLKLPPPPRPKNPSQLTELASSHGGIVEWTASDGRKGKLTGMGKPRLTGASLAKVASNTRPTKHPTDAKDCSRASASSKHVKNTVDAWNTCNLWHMEENGAPKKSGSKKAPSNKDNSWPFEQWNASGSNKGSRKAASTTREACNSGDVGDTWAPQAVAADWDTKADEKKDDNSNTKTEACSTKSGVAKESVAPDTNAAEKNDKKEPDDSNTWTKEQDQKLMQMKTDFVQFGTIPWSTVAENIGKSTDQCRVRWKEIKPSDWTPNDMQKKTGKGAMGKKTDAGNNDQKHTNNDKDSRKGKAKTKDEATDNGSWLGGLNGLLGDNDIDNKEENKQSNDWNTTTGLGCGNSNNRETDQAKDCTNSWDNVDGAGDANNKDVGDSWGQTTGDATVGAWDTTDWQSNNNTGGGIRASNEQDRPCEVKPTSAPRSNRANCESRSHCSNTSKSKPDTYGPAEIELEPDDTFSAADLRLIARILQQDCSLVWDRVSWRFRDKTGRTLHPDMFEKKVTGTVESKSNGSESGKRKN